MLTYEVIGELENGQRFGFVVTCESAQHARSIVFYNFALANRTKNLKEKLLVSWMETTEIRERG